MSRIIEAETRQLFALARDKSAEGREALIATVGDLFVAEGDALNDCERALMSDILRNLVNEVEITVRRRLAEQLSQRSDAPHDVVLSLANDNIEVAYPILLRSKVLQDLELVEIVHHRTLEYQLAIAMRESVSETVSDALVAAGEVDVIKTLLENTGAAISQSTLEYLAEESKRVDLYQNPLLSRPDFGRELAQKMYWWVSAALREHILAHFDIAVTEVDDAIERTVNSLAADDRTERSKSEVFDQLAAQGNITPQLLVQTLRRGEIAFFETLFAKTIGIRLTLIRRLLFERGGEGLAIACKAVKIDVASFASIYVLSRKARPYEPPPERGEVTRLLKFYHEMNQQAAEALLGKWRRDPNFLSAVWHIGRHNAAD
jgi:uncharacterized protein (DUF2336 family)